jgi:DNA-binding XRE family transcriptional regulator
MLVHAKTPPINVQISGEGAEFLIETLRRSIAGLSVSTDDEAIPINSDPWFKAFRQSRSAGDVLWVYRDNAKFTLDELAEKSGIAKSHLSEMENNKRPIGLKSARKLAAALNCDFHRFLVAEPR